jgi:spermidine/putrescine transport system ATP-binding protein
VTLEIRAGEFFSLLGPSGCGKTTTLRMIGGFELPTAGRILVGGLDVTMAPPEKRPVNMVFQSYALFPHLSVFENIAFGLRRRKTPQPEVEERVGAALELVRLGTFGKRRPDQLSGGQQQRVALARALVNRPQVLLLDEPLGALDLKLRRQLQVELKRVQLEVGITFIYVTHDQEEALALSDRIAVMDHGRVEQLGTPEELYDAPRTLFVAGFIGTSNLLPGVVETVVDGIASVRLDGGEPVQARAGGTAAGDLVDVAIRPEAILLAADDVRGDERGDEPGEDPDGAGLAAEVLQSAYLGVSVSHQVRTAGGAALTVVVPRGGPRPELGDAVRLSWRAADAMVLPRHAAAEPVEEVP